MEHFDLNRIVHEARATSSGYHFVVARGWRLIGEKDKLHSPLAYSAFEFRCAIERCLVEFLVLIKDRKPSKADLRSMNSISALKKAILRSAGGKREFERTQIFNRLFSQAGLPPQFWIAIVDLDRLEKYWASLSEYCHRQLRPDATWESMGNEWLIDGYKLLNTVEAYLWEIMITSHFGWVHPSDIQPEMRAAMNEFVQGRISQKQLETRLNLMAPIIAERVRRLRSRNAG
jgi:hypothetical protein